MSTQREHPPSAQNDMSNDFPFPQNWPLQAPHHYICPLYVPNLHLPNSLLAWTHHHLGILAHRNPFRRRNRTCWRSGICCAGCRYRTRAHGDCCERVLPGDECCYCGKPFGDRGCARRDVEGAVSKGIERARGRSGGEFLLCFEVQTNQSEVRLTVRCRLFKERSRMWTMSEVSMEILAGLSSGHIYKLLSMRILYLWFV